MSPAAARGPQAGRVTRPLTSAAVAHPSASCPAPTPLRAAGTRFGEFHVDMAGPDHAVAVDGAHERWADLGGAYLTVGIATGSDRVVIRARRTSTRGQVDPQRRGVRWPSRNTTAPAGHRGTQ